MKSGRMGTIFGIGMIIGSLPCTFAILLFYQLVAAREVGHPAGADPIALMMISVLAYAIALLSFVSGIIYFGFAVLKNNLALRAWHWFSIVYSFSQITIPVVYFSTR